MYFFGIDGIEKLIKNHQKLFENSYVGEQY